jgi:hypothetical protein
MQFVTRDDNIEAGEMVLLIDMSPGVKVGLSSS